MYTLHEHMLLQVYNVIKRYDNDDGKIDWKCMQNGV